MFYPQGLPNCDPYNEYADTWNRQFCYTLFGNAQMEQSKKDMMKYIPDYEVFEGKDYVRVENGRLLRTTIGAFEWPFYILDGTLEAITYGTVVRDRAKAIEALQLLGKRKR